MKLPEIVTDPSLERVCVCVCVCVRIQSASAFGGELACSEHALYLPLRFAGSHFLPGRWDGGGGLQSRTRLWAEAALMLTGCYWPIGVALEAKGLEPEPWGPWMSPGCDGSLHSGLGHGRGLGAWGAWFDILLQCTQPTWGSVLA